MPRSVNAVASRARRKRYLKAAKGYFGARSKVYTVAKNAVEKAWGYSYRDRRNKKRVFRRLWIARINAAARQNGTTYSRLMHGLSTAGVGLNRKVLADLAMNHPEAFTAVVNSVKK
jgi:large subunit ribosomal protein L20